MARLKDMYKNDVAPALMQKFAYKSPMQIPKLDKIVVNVGTGDAKENSKVIDTVIDEIDGVNHMTPVDSVPAQLSHVNQGACDAITYNVENRGGLLAANPDLVAIQFDGSYQLFPDEVSCNVGLKKGQDDVLKKVNDAIAAMGADDSTWETIIARQPA